MTSRAGSLQSIDESLLDLGDLEPPQAQAEADDFFLDLLDDAPAQVRKSTPSFNEPDAPLHETAAVSAAPSVAAEEMEASARASYEEETAKAAPQAQEFAEGQVLGEDMREEFAVVEAEAQPVFESQAAEAAHSQGAPGEFFANLQTAPTERLPEAPQVEDTPANSGDAESYEAASASPVAGQITLSQMSPELIDAIARRVVEQLSAQAIEQIAWEVVPDLAERLIQRRLDEEKR
jgi:hypothetical protein